MKNMSQFIDDVLDEVSGKHAWDWVAKITQYNRMRGSQDFHEIAEKVMEEFNKYGLDEVKLHQYPCDGECKTWEWVAPVGWEISTGVLRLVEPQKEVLCRFKEVPMCVLEYSKSCDVTAEVIDVGEGASEEDYRGKDVEGKIILMSAPELFIPPLYVSKGAIGVIVYPDPKKSVGFRDLTNYNRFPVKKDILEKTTFGFSISHEKALRLKELLKKGTVKVHATTDANVITDKDLEVISATIRGTEFPEEEIIISAHICHPAAGANDNASGTAGVIELARAFTNLINKEVLPPPKRTIRFLLGPEFDGTWPWVKEHEEIAKNALINLNLDMIGEHPMRIGEPCYIMLSPYSRSSILNDVLRFFTEIIADHPKGIAVNGTKVPMRYRIMPFSGGSDHQVFVDTAIGIPGMMFGHPDPLWHTSLDTMEYSDSTEMQRVIGIALCTSYLFATLKGNELLNVWPIIEEGFYQRLGKAKKVLMNLYNVLSTNGDGKDSDKNKILKEEKAILGRTLIEAAVYHEKGVLESLKKFGTLSSNEETLISAKNDELNQWNNAQQALWNKLCKNTGIDLSAIVEPEDFTNQWAPSFIGLQNLEDLFPIAISPQFDKIKVPEPPRLSFGDLHELLLLVGLSLDLKMICATLTIEYQHFFYPSEVNKFLKFLVRKKLIKKR